MATAGEVVTLAPRPLPRVWATAIASFPAPVGPEWEPDQFGIKRWLNGITFTPWGTDKSLGFPIDPCADRTTTYNEFGDCVDFYPFLAEFAVEAKIGLHETEEVVAYVQAHSQVSRSSRLAEQLETAAHNSLSPSLASEATAIANADQSLMGALLAVEDALADVLDGGAGMIHMPAMLLPALQAGGGLRYDADGRAFTATGHLIVADAGTIGVSPATGAEVVGEIWIYGSGPVFMKWDDEVTLVDQSRFHHVYIPRNRYRIDAEMYGIVYFDPSTVVAAMVDISDNDIVGQGGDVDGGGA